MRSRQPWISLISLLFVISAAPLCWSLLAWSLFPDQPYGRAWTMGAIIPLDTEQLSLWRLLIAPLLHEDGAHLFVNLSLSALFLIPLSVPTHILRGPKARWGELFVVTHVGGMLALLPRALLPLGDDWSLGLSGGVYALAGLLSAQLHSPRARVTLSLLFALQGGLGASVDRVAHWTGLGLGLSWGSLRFKSWPLSLPWSKVGVLYAALWIPAILSCWSSFHQLDFSPRSGITDSRCLQRMSDGRLIRCLLRDEGEDQRLTGV
ncbi:MAG: rhomboid family intramembrane serine protease, partial [Myxococcota bacterium]|nr:rhomboid family intramembrane serine protease [Myxococcota bacterium]